MESNNSSNIAHPSSENGSLQSFLVRRNDHFALLKDDKCHEHLKDVKIEIGNQTFSAHKLVLANSIPYFAEEFQSTNTIELIKVTNNDVKPESIYSFITYAYTGGMTVTEENVFSILKTAKFLKTDSIINDCQRFIMRLMINDFESESQKDDFLYLDIQSLENVLSNNEFQANTESIFNFIMNWVTHDYESRKMNLAKLLGLIKMNDLGDDYINCYLYQKDVFRDLDVESLENVLSIADFKANTMLIFNGIIKWITHNYDNRINHLDKLLLDLIKLNEINADRINHYLYHGDDAIGKNFTSLAFELHSRQYQSMIQAQSRDNDDNEATSDEDLEINVDDDYEDEDEDATSTTNSYENNTHNNNLNHGDLEHRSPNSFEERDITSENSSIREQSENNTITTEYTENQSNVGLAEYLDNQDENLESNSLGRLEMIKKTRDEKIIIIGLTTDASIVEYDPKTQKWSTVRKANWCAFCSVTVHDGKLYKFQGLEKNACSSKTVEVYDTDTKEWQTLSPMNTMRKECGAVYLKNFLYACGGNISRLEGTTNTVERYSFESKKWERISSMNERRCLPAVLVFRDCIYAIGGSQLVQNRPNDDYLDTVEVYDPETGEWSILEAKLNTKRSSCAATVLDGKIYVCGGWNGKTLNVVEMFDPKLKRWITVQSMNRARKKFLVVGMCGKLLAIGGCSKEEQIEALSDSSVEVYNPDTDDWRYVNTRCNLTNQRMYLSGGIIEGKNNTNRALKVINHSSNSQ